MEGFAFRIDWVHPPRSGEHHMRQDNLPGSTVADVNSTQLVHRRSRHRIRHLPVHHNSVDLLFVRTEESVQVLLQFRPGDRHGVRHCVEVSENRFFENPE
ncbi:unnamed protein product [Nesidiocoris tenuis]|uniref:Uncharacterized protein n=1 Tax=Nesidiocoris tenuis TaxID=355587 RepID=A0A6H5H942_9HEMI|nr:unnamed protein product [Nesidiocoris tenuis]